MHVKIGVLLPSSRMFPRLDACFLAGLKCALAETDLAPELLIEPVGNAAVRDIMTEKVQRLLIQEPHIVTGIIGSGVAPHVHTFFSDRSVPFIVNNLGADPLTLGGEENPFLFHNSLNLWQSSYALGFWAAGHAGKRTAIATSFHEAGYDMIRAFSQGFSYLGGGTILGTEVTHRASAVEDPIDSLKRIADLEPDFIAAFYSGREGVTFMKAYDALGLQAQLPIVATPMMIHGNWLPQIGAAAAGTRTAISWDGAACAETQAGLRAAWGTKREDEPAVFCLLGYESGMLIGQALADGATDPRDGESLRRGIAGKKIDSPRGELTVDPATGEVLTTDYLHEICPADGGLRAVSHGRLELPASCRSDRAHYKREAGRSGWLNPYLVN